MATGTLRDMTLRDVTSERAVVVGAAALLVAGAVGAGVVASGGGLPLPAQDHPVVTAPELSATVAYDEAAETATLTVTGHPIRNDERSTDVSAVYV